MAHYQTILLLANQWIRAHHTNKLILSLTFRDQTTLNGTPYVLSAVHTCCSSESSNIGLGHGEEEHTSRFIVHELVSGHYTFINMYRCWKATSWGSLIKQNIDGTALALNTYFFSLRWGYLRVVTICLWTYLGIWRRKLAKGKIWIPCLCVFSCKARSMCMV